jgi:type III restriction enzyme
MERNKFLYQKLLEEFGRREIKNVLLPPIVKENLNPNFPLRSYQEEAFKYFLKY